MIRNKNKIMYWPTSNQRQQHIRVGKKRPTDRQWFFRGKIFGLIGAERIQFNEKVSGLVVHFLIVQIIRVEIFRTSMVLTEIRQALEREITIGLRNWLNSTWSGSKRVNMGPICPLGIFILSLVIKARLCLR